MSLGTGLLRYDGSSRANDQGGASRPSLHRRRQGSAPHGCRRLHLVDLNGAFEGKPVNGDAVTAIARRYPDLPIQIGGGIRSLETIEEYVKAGVSYVIIGTKAVKEPEFVGEACRAFPGKVIVGLDAKDGFVATDGWAEVSSIQVVDLAKRFEADGVSAIVSQHLPHRNRLWPPGIVVLCAATGAQFFRRWLCRFQQAPWPRACTATRDDGSVAVGVVAMDADARTKVAAPAWCDRLVLNLVDFSLILLISININCLSQKSEKMAYSKKEIMTFIQNEI
mgnify:CR=1 FL=1